MRATRYGDTVDFFSHYVNKPYLSRADKAIIAAQDHTEVLSNPKPKAPFDDISIEKLDAIK